MEALPNLSSAYWGGGGRGHFLTLVPPIGGGWTKTLPNLSAAYWGGGRGHFLTLVPPIGGGGRRHFLTIVPPIGGVDGGTS